MKLQTTGRKVTLKESFIARVEKRLAKMERYFGSEAQAFLTVAVEKGRQTVELTIKDTNFTVRSQRTAEGMEQAFDAAADAVTKQVNKNRTRLATRLHQGAGARLEGDFPEEGAEEYTVVKEKHFVLRPETVEEAILQMNLLGHDFYMFHNAESGAVNVVYKRSGGGYSLLVPV